MRIHGIAFAALVLSFALNAFAAGSVDGEWEADMPAREGTTPATLKLKVKEKGKLTGSITTSRGESEIQGGKVEGDQVSFKQILRPGNREVTIIYTGTVDGDEIQFKRELPEFGVERDFTAKRKK